MKNGAVQTIAQRSKEEQEKVEADIIQQREEWDRRRKMKFKRERGWSGRSWGGVSLGPPDPGPNGGGFVWRKSATCARELEDVLYVCLFTMYACKKGRSLQFPPSDFLNVLYF
ncbi:28S ribosomal protein S5, mitochondrial [Saguinus oedipus]|uniref:28S ribosomal protein S5, mitochondrial n=1 Tax=Saguinus oedipus TaxID=9490 RepID=A0ABQ9U889_SAGOE|nr:28S ribosomal protein S5, mitochondrial [Saguinus oedipus]